MFRDVLASQERRQETNMHPHIYFCELTGKPIWIMIILSNITAWFVCELTAIQHRWTLTDSKIKSLNPGSQMSLQMWSKHPYPPSLPPVFFLSRTNTHLPFFALLMPGQPKKCDCIIKLPELREKRIITIRDLEMFAR